MSRRRSLILAGMAAVAVAVPVQDAGADSIVYTQPDGNVYLADPDGTHVSAVTHDGTPQDPYGAPSQSDGGTIVTWRDNTFRVLQQNGHVLASFKPIVPPGGAISDAAISPDASKIAYTVVYRDATCGSTVCSAMFVTAADRPADLGVVLASWQHPSWYGDADLVTSFSGRRVGLFGLGDGGVREWFGGVGGDAYLANAFDAELTQDGDRIVAMRGLTAGTHVSLYETNGDPPAPPLPGCELANPRGRWSSQPTWAPGGDKLAWALDDHDRNTPPGPGEGVYVLDIGNTGDLVADCIGTTPVLVFPGASNPDWSPAPNAPPVRTPTPTPTPTPPTRSPSPSPNLPPKVSGLTVTKARGGSTVTYRLSEPATVTFTVTQQLPGRRSGKKCVKPTRANNKRARCTIPKPVRGALTRKAQTGRNTFKFNGRIGDRRLGPGRYVLTAVAVDAGKAKSQPYTVQFTIPKR